MSDHRGINRRDLLKSGTVIGAGAAAMGMLSGAGFQAPAAQAAPVPETWDMETDVVVVGASGSGLCAAVAAAEAGAEVVMVEKNDYVGGLWIAAGGHAIVGASPVHEREGIEDNLEWWYEDEMATSDYRGVPELIRTYVDRGPETIAWLEEMGLVFGFRSPACPGHRVNRSIQPVASDNYPGGLPQSGGISWIVVLQRKVEEQGTQILLEHAMTRVIREPDGPVLGIEVDNAGTLLNIKARKGVVLTSGGYADNAQFCVAWDPRLGFDSFGDGNAPPGTEPYTRNVGDAHRAAMEVGAGLTDMSFVAFAYIRWGTKQYYTWEPRDWSALPEAGTGAGLPLGGQGFQRVIMVKNDGRRYINEAEGARSENPEKIEQPFPSAYLNLPDRPRNVWAITDADGVTELAWSWDQLENPDPLGPRALYPDSIAIADSLSELAEKIGVPAENLIETIGRYNSFAEHGEDEEFGKPAPLYKLVKRPYVAVKAHLIRHTQNGGLRTNTKAQVLDRADMWVSEAASIDEEAAIPRLYAAGECVGFQGWRRPHGKLNNCATFGRIAGTNAAAEEPLE